MNRTGDDIQKLQGAQRITSAASFLLVSAMLACLTISFTHLGEAIVKGWQADYLAWLAFFVALEAMYSQRRMARVSFTEPGYLIYRAAEWIIILLLVKVAYYFSAGFGLLRLDLPLWQEDFERYFFNGEYLFGVVCMFLVWLIAGIFSNELAALEVTDAELRAEVESGVFEKRPESRERIANIFLGLGMLMVFLSAALRFDMAANWFEMPAMRAGVYNLLVYFLLGLVLLSLTQYNLMRVSWLLDKMPIQKEIGGRWFLYSFLFILLVAVVAGVLPTSYSIGLIATLKFAAFAIFGAIQLLVWLIAFPFVWLFNLLLTWLRADESQAVAITPPEIPRYEPPVAAAGGTPLPWLELLKSVLFWGFLLAAVGFAIYYYLHEHKDLLAALRKIPFFSSLARFWEWLRRQAGGINRRVSAAVDESWQRLKERLRRKPIEDAWKFIRLGSLSRRGQVLFYYLALVRRGGEQGIPRKAAQTPFEYSQTLEQALSNRQPEAAQPEIAEQIAGLTDRFVDARYSLHEVTEQDVGVVRRYWQRLRKFLRGKDGVEEVNKKTG